MPTKPWQFGACLTCRHSSLVNSWNSSEKHAPTQACPPRLAINRIAISLTNTFR